MNYHVMSKLYIVRNEDGSRKAFTTKPTLMSQEKIKELRKQHHCSFSNVPMYCDPVWVVYDPSKGTMSTGGTIANVVVSALGIEYKKMSTTCIYELDISQPNITETI